METDAPQASRVQRRPPVPPPQPAKPKDKQPCMVDEASMKKWCNDMLKGHPDGHVTTWEQWSNSLALQFKGAMGTMSESLRIKEDAYVKMFEGKEKALKESKGNLKKIKDIEEKVASLMKPDDKVKILEIDNAFLREKLQVSEEKLKTEINSNIILFSTIRMNLKASKEATLGSTDEERKRFLSEATCIELLSPVDLKRESTYCMDVLPEEFPLHGPDGVLFIKTTNPKSVAMMIRMYTSTWDNLEIDKLKADQERRRTTSGSSSHSLDEPQPS